MDCSTPGFPVLHHLQELAQTHAHQEGMCFCWVLMFASDGCLGLSSGMTDEGWCWWRAKGGGPGAGGEEGLQQELREECETWVA